MTTASLTGSRLVGGRYALEALIGRGGMGEVWRARHVALKSRVAIKFLQGAPSPSERAKRRFLTEAQVTANLRTRHAVQVFDFGVTDDGLPYLVMELLEGETLDKRIAREGRLSLSATSVLLQKAARALERAHQLGIVHRDFKPENIMLVVDEEDGGELVKVVDFGIAKLVGDLDATLKSALSSLAQARRLSPAPSPRGVAGGPTPRAPAERVLEVTSGGVGTPYYMAPEQVQDSAQIGPAADIWAFGVVAYECVTGRRPFDDESIGKLLLRVLAAAPPTPASSLAPVPALFDDWFRVACARNPENRFPDVQTAAAELARALDSAVRSGRRVTPIHARRALAAEPSPKGPSTARSRAVPQRSPSTMSLVPGGVASGPALRSPAEVVPGGSAPGSARRSPAAVPQAAPTLSSRREASWAEVQGARRAVEPRHGSRPSALPLHVSPLAATLEPAAPLAPPSAYAPPPRLLRALPASFAFAAALLTLVLAVHDPGRAPARVAIARSTVPAPTPAALLADEPVVAPSEPMLDEPAVASSRPAPETSPLRVTPPSRPVSRRRPLEASPSAYRLPPLGL